MRTPPASFDSMADRPMDRRSAPRLSRRDLLRGGRPAPPPPGPSAVRSLAPATWDVSADVDPGSLLIKLIRRTTMGLAPMELALANPLGYQGYLDYQLNYTAIDDTLLNLRLALLTTLSMTPNLLFFQSSAAIIEELMSASVLRGIFSKRQLFERVVEFWTDHFNIDITKEDCAFLKTVDDASVIRRQGLTTFPQLLNASAQSPAMLIYLDNYVSVKGSPNENYARELLELHTMGSDAGYTQDDVEALAKCLTGWTVYDRGAAPQVTGTFKFNDANHDKTEKRLLGNIIPAGGGISDGFTALQIITQHPATARFIARKLIRWFLGEGAPAHIIDDVAATYTATGGDIKAMIRKVFTPRYLYAAPPRYKRPGHLFYSALRALGCEVQATWNLEQLMDGAGHLPFHWITPDGYPDSVDYWGGLVLNRWNFGAPLPEGLIPGLWVDIPAFFPQRTPQAVMDKIDLVLFGNEMPPNDKAIIRAHLEQYPGDVPLIREAVGLAIGSPGFQWY